jgi:hypothetical protein
MNLSGIETLFEQHSISEIENIQSKLREDVAKKQDELRQIVG